MGINLGSTYFVNSAKPAIDSSALAKVTEQILKPSGEQAQTQTVDVSKLNLSKFNRVNIGTDLYSARTSGEEALKAAKTATDFNIKFSPEFAKNVQYLNSQAAQSLFTTRENNGKVVITVDNVEKVDQDKIVLATSQVAKTEDLNKDKKGSNPFSFYMPANQKEENEDNESTLNSINIFA